MKLPRSLSGTALAQALAVYGYEVRRWSGGHIQLVKARNGGHAVTVPAHKVLKTGTLAGVLAAVARHVGVSRGEVLSRIFGPGS
ncbi:MAG: type II toxin-antitoxin system HicA family toxin [candidate division WOR-3 bacterium]